MAAWYSKATYLLDIYQESDPHVAHLMAAVYLYATPLDYVSPDLEWLANAFVAEMKMKIRSSKGTARLGPSRSGRLWRRRSGTPSLIARQGVRRVKKGQNRPSLVLAYFEVFFERILELNTTKY
jgi:hypothetical protein